MFSDPETPTDPGLVIDRIVELIDMQPGIRPFRSVVGVDVGVTGRNAAVEPFDTAALEAFGLTAFAKAVARTFWLGRPEPPGHRRDPALQSTGRRRHEAWTPFPDMLVAMDSVEGEKGLHWTWTGANTGPGGTGRSVRISGYEEWTWSPAGRIAESRGHYDAAEYERQVSGGRGGR